MWSRLDFDITNLFYEGLDKVNKDVLTSSKTTFADLQMAGGQSLIAVVKLLRELGFDDDNIRGRVFGFSENGLYLSIVKEQLKDLGASKVLDEYFANKSNQSTGGHFHVEVMKDGGIIKANPGGTLVQAAEAGINEAFVPLPNGKSIPVTLGDKLTEKLTDKLNPEKMLINLLTKSIPGLGKAMTAATIADTAGSSEMSTSEKILEIAKILNPTVRLVSKLYDTYQAVSAASFSEKSNTAIPDVNEIISARSEQQQASNQDLITKLSTALTSTSSGSNDNSASMSAMVEMLAEKLDSMNNKLETSNDIQDNLLKYSRI
jgi:hypothetical protein